MAARKNPEASAVLAEAIDEALVETVETHGGVDEVDIAAMFSRDQPTEPRTAKGRLAALVSPFRKGGRK